MRVIAKIWETHGDIPLVEILAEVARIPEECRASAALEHGHENPEWDTPRAVLYYTVALQTP